MHKSLGIVLMCLLASGSGLNSTAQDSVSPSRQNSQLEVSADFTTDPPTPARQPQARVQNAAAPRPAQPDPVAAKRFLRQKVSQAPLTFVPAAADGGSTSLFHARGLGFEISLQRDGLSILTLSPESSPASTTKPATMGSVRGLPVSSGVPATSMHAAFTQLHFLNSNTQARVEGLDPISAKSNLFLGNDPSQWQRNLPNYRRVKYSSIYPGIDLIYYGEAKRRLEYDLVVSPNADPDAIRLKVAGGRQATIDEAGDLRLDGKDGKVLLHRPMLYQDIANGKKAIAGNFVQLANNEFGFKHAQYDRSKPLIIDPTLSLLYSTFMGGIHEDAAGALALDAQNNVYITGVTASQDFPVSANAFLNQLVKPYEYELNTFVMKFDSSGTLLFSTYLGGSGNNGALSDAGHPGDEPAPRNIGIDAAGNVYLAGTTTSTDFPVTSNAYQSNNTGTQVGYLAELSPDGSTLEYGSYFGGAAPLVVGSIARAANGQIYVAGTASSGLPTTAGAYKPTLATAPTGQAPYEAAFVSVFDITQSGDKQLVASTYYGTDSPQPNVVYTGNLGYSMALDSKGDPWLVGQSYTNNLPTTANAYQPSLPAVNTYCGATAGPLNSTGYIAEFNPSLTSLQYASYLSGINQPTNLGNNCSEYINGIALDSSDNIYVDGATASATFPVTVGALQTTVPASNAYSEFVAKLNAGGTKISWATYLGGSTGSTFSGNLIPDAAGNVWVVGITEGGSNFPISADAYQPTGPTNGNFAGFIDEISADGSKLVYGTYFGGSAGTTVLDLRLDANENVYVTGSTSNTAMPVTPNALQPMFANGDQNPDNTDAFFAILGGGTIGVISPIVGGNTGDTTITLSGAGFEQGATCSIVEGGTTIASVQATVNASGTSISCTFALNGAATGSYNVVVTNPDGSSYSKPDGFQVVTGQGSNISVDVVGRPLIRTGAPSSFYVTVSNTGDADAYGVMLMITYSNTLSPVNPSLADPFNLPLFAYPPVAQGDTTDYSTIPIVLPSSVDPSASFVPLLISRVPAGSTFAYSFPLVAGQDGVDFYFQVGVWDPFADSESDLSSSSAMTSRHSQSIERLLTALGTGFAKSNGGAGGSSGSDPCVQALIQYAWNKAASNIIGAPGNCISNFIDTLENTVNYPVLTAALGNIGTKADSDGSSSQAVAQVMHNLSNALIDCGEAAGEDVTAVGSFLKALYEALENAQAISDACKPNPGPKRNPKPNPNKSKKKKGKSASAVDPNFKSGPTGDGSPSSYVNGFTPFQFEVGFENEPTAALPAAAVVVTDQLDPAKFDLSTVALGTIAIGPDFINLAQGTNNFSKTFSLSAALSVRIQGSLDPSSGLLKWTFQTIDPTTGLPPTDPTIGFLPPDTDGIVGQGSVLFTVMPKAGQTTGTQVTNNATVVFDANAPISTPTWLNTLDVNPPVSKVAALPATESTNSFTVSWSGTDVGSGVASFSIYVSDNGGPFTAWQSSVTTTSATYSSVIAGHTYSFYSIATDNAGNVEAAKTAAEATTLFPGVTTSTSLTASATQITPGTSVTLTATVAPASGTVVPTGSITFMIGATTLGSSAVNASGVATLTTSGLPIGSDTITAQYGGDTNFATSVSTAVIVVVNKFTTSTALTASSASANLGTSLTFTATVTPVSNSVVPTGIVTFEDGATALGTGTLNASGIATYTTSALTAGTHTITAQYEGDSTNAGSTSASLTEIVVAPAFTVSASPTTITVAEGQSGNATITLTPVGGFNQQTSFACSGLPSFSTCTFSPASLTPNGSNTAVTATVTISTGVTTARLASPFRPNPPGSERPGALAALLLLGLGSLLRARKQLWRCYPIATALLLAAFLGLSAISSIGCGGGNSHRTPTGTSSVTVTASAGAENQTTTITLVVQ